ncbi:MAG TPA: zinc-ribbon domain-containing protein [Longimicrobiales bacterium]|nr:zinc-ribbon domain-containing protein [Longimicrobiales bacterium]
MNIACPQCSRVYRVDPARVPHGGIVARCRACGAQLRIEPGDTAPGEVRTAAPAPSATQAGGSGADVPPAPEPAPTGGSDAKPPVTPAFGPQDPETRAKRLARALVSDIVVYNPEKLHESRSAGTLRKEFRDEILKSWEEYVEQVGEEMARKTSYFRDALNTILAEGNQVF